MGQAPPVRVRKAGIHHLNSKTISRKLSYDVNNQADSFPTASTGHNHGRAVGWVLIGLGRNAMGLNERTILLAQAVRM